LNEIKNEKDAVVQLVRPQLRGSDLLLSESTAKAAREADRAAVDAVRVEQAAKQGEELLTKLRKSVGDVGAANLAIYYRDQAKTHSDQARGFLIGSALALGIGILLGLWGLRLEADTDRDQRHGPQGWGSFLRGLIVRVLLIGAVSYAIGFLTRNYRVNKHLQPVDETTRNALETFSLFSESVAPEDRPVLTAELARVVFAYVETRFLSASQEKTIVETGPGLSALLTQRPRVQP
jgi:hypothetical protein